MAWAPDPDERQEIFTGREQISVQAAGAASANSGPLPAGRVTAHVVEAVAAVPNETAVPLTEIGHGFGGEDGSNFAEAAEGFR